MEIQPTETKGNDMIFQIGNWVIPRRDFLLPIDSERTRKEKGSRLKIRSREPLEILDIQGFHGEKKLIFRGRSGRYLAAFFEPATKPMEKLAKK